MNRQAQALADRTRYLKDQVEKSSQSLIEHEKSTNHPNATTTQKGFVKLSSAVNSDDEATAATSKAVKLTYERAASNVNSVNGKKDHHIILTAKDIGALPEKAAFQLNSEGHSAHYSKEINQSGSFFFNDEEQQYHMPFKYGHVARFVEPGFLSAFELAMQYDGRGMAFRGAGGGNIKNADQLGDWHHIYSTLNPTPAVRSVWLWNGDSTGAVTVNTPADSGIVYISFWGNGYATWQSFPLNMAWSGQICGDIDFGGNNADRSATTGVVITKNSSTQLVLTPIVTQGSAARTTHLIYVGFVY